MGIREKLVDEPPHYPRSICRVCHILTQLDQGDREFLVDNFNKPSDDKSRFSDAKIADILTEEGYSVGLQSVSRHRRKQCGSR